MKKMYRSFLAVVLACALVVPAASLGAFAEDGSTDKISQYLLSEIQKCEDLYAITIVPTLPDYDELEAEVQKLYPDFDKSDLDNASAEAKEYYNTLKRDYYDQLHRDIIDKSGLSKNKVIETVWSVGCEGVLEVWATADQIWKAAALDEVDEIRQYDEKCYTDIEFVYTAADAFHILRTVAGFEEATGNKWGPGAYEDVDWDGTITARDALLAQKSAAGLICLGPQYIDYQNKFKYRDR